MASARFGGPQERRFVGPAAGPNGGAPGANGDNGDGPGDGGDGQAQGFGEGGAPGGRSGRKRGELGRASETAIVDTIIEENAAYETKATPAPSPPRRYYPRSLLSSPACFRNGEQARSPEDSFGDSFTSKVLVEHSVGSIAACVNPRRQHAARLHNVSDLTPTTRSAASQRGSAASLTPPVLALFARVPSLVPISKYPEF